jgi:hypothetical protein
VLLDVLALAAVDRNEPADRRDARQGIGDDRAGEEGADRSAQRIKEACTQRQIQMRNEISAEAGAAAKGREWEGNGRGRDLAAAAS